MPLYSFKDTTTDEVFDVLMSMKDLDEYKEQHPTHQRYIDSAPVLVSGVSVTGKLDSGFKDVLSKISEAHPGSPLANEHGKRSIKQVQTERAVRKWRGSAG
jgi:predicted nucleic acid-binding Zn ribbon protein